MIGISTEARYYNANNNSPISVNSWSSLELISDITDNFNSTNPKLLIDSFDDVHAFWVTNNDLNLFRLEHRIFSSSTWSSIEILWEKSLTTLESDRFNFDCAIDSLDRLHIVWNDDNGLHHKYFDGTAWSTKFTITTDLVKALKINSDESSNVHLIWISDYLGDDNFFYSSFSSTSWSISYVVTNFDFATNYITLSKFFDFDVSNNEIFLLYQNTYYDPISMITEPEMRYSYYNGTSWLNAIIYNGPYIAIDFEIIYDDIDKLHIFLSRRTERAITHQTMSDFVWSSFEEIYIFPSPDYIIPYYSDIWAFDAIIFGTDIFITTAVYEIPGGPYYDLDIFLSQFNGSGWYTNQLIVSDDYITHLPSIICSQSDVFIAGVYNQRVPYSFDKEIFFQYALNFYQFQPTGGFSGFVLLLPIFTSMMFFLVQRKKRI